MVYGNPPQHHVHVYFGMKAAKIQSKNLEKGYPILRSELFAVLDDPMSVILEYGLSDVAGQVPSRYSGLMRQAAL